MKTRLAARVLLPVLLVSLSSSFAVESRPLRISETAATLLKLQRGDVNEQVIVTYIQNARRNFDLSADDIVYLKKEGVSDKIVSAALSHRAKFPQVVVSAPQPQPQQPATVQVQPAPQPTVIVAPPQTTYIQTAPAPVYVYSAPSYRYYNPYPYSYSYYPYRYRHYGYHYPGYSYSYPRFSFNVGFGRGYHGGFYRHHGWSGHHHGGGHRWRH
jgi:hypothetical protein